MPIDPNSQEVLEQFPNEIAASVVLHELTLEGIWSVLTGVNTASFRAEAPGLVSVVVRQQDVERARQILESVRNPETPTDWEQVDVGEPE